MSWYKGKLHFPPTFELKEGRPQKIIFKEKTVREVGGKYRRELVIEIEVPPKKELRSLFLSHKDLQRRIALLQKKHNDSLLDVTVEITQIEKTTRVGNPWYKYKVRDMIDGEFIN